MPKHKVLFEPVGFDLDADEEETVLGAAFRQGVSLFHGHREGQCSACKQFLLDGDLEMDHYFTFALNEYEAEEEYVLLYRAHAYSDLEIESLTPEINRLLLKLVDPPEIAFRAGQFAEIYVPTLSEPGPVDEWDREKGLITNVLERLEEDLTGTEAYLAGPLTDAALLVLEGEGVEEDKIFYDKFTESGAVEGEEDKEESGPEQAKEVIR